MEYIFDTHAHYNDEAYSADLDEVISKMRSTVCGAIICGTNYKSSQNCVNLAKKYSGFFYAAVGIHPEELEQEYNEQYLLNLAKSPEVIAIGEIGLDYYYDNFSKEQQKLFFEKQILTAKKANLPIIVHDREAHGDTLEILKKHHPSGVLHCFSGSVETAKEVINLGMYIGVGGVITFKNAKKAADVVASLPLERLLLETDSPYLTPYPFRGSRNRSDYIIYIAQKIAEIKNLDADTIIKVSRENTKNLFKI